jgi:hypothetical protein
VDFAVGELEIEKNEKGEALARQFTSSMSISGERSRPAFLNIN